MLVLLELYNTNEADHYSKIENTLGKYTCLTAYRSDIRSLQNPFRNLLCITILLEYPAVPTSICMCPTLSCCLPLKCNAGDCISHHLRRKQIHQRQDNASIYKAEAGSEGRAPVWLSHKLPLNTPQSRTKTFTGGQGKVCMKHRIVHH